MTLSSSETIDAAERGNAGRFLNHSCDPNCETQKWMVNGELCIGIYALEDIRDAEELTFDYNFERYGDNPIKCFCGTTKCGGWIGGGAKDGEEVVGGGRTDVRRIRTRGSTKAWTRTASRVSNPNPCSPRLFSTPTAWSWRWCSW